MLVICMQCMQIDSITRIMNVQVRNVPDDVHRQLKVRAARSGRSLNEYLLAQLQDVAFRPTLADLAERAHARGVSPVPSREDVLAAIREGREGR
jgi:plasmid stability protein